jgi:hypothetical protein
MTLDLQAMQSAILAGLPRQRRWLIKDTTIDYDFSVAQYGLGPFAEATDETIDPREKKWFDLLIFGNYDYAEGGGAYPFLGIRKTDGAIYGLDPELEGEAMFLINSSLDRFIRTFSLLDEFLSLGKPTPPTLESRLRAIDPDVYDESDWKLFVVQLLQSD